MSSTVRSVCERPCVVACRVVSCRAVHVNRLGAADSGRGRWCGTLAAASSARCLAHHGSICLRLFTLKASLRSPFFVGSSLDTQCSATRAIVARVSDTTRPATRTRPTARHAHAHHTRTHTTNDTTRHAHDQRHDTPRTSTTSRAAQRRSRCCPASRRTAPCPPPPSQRTDATGQTPPLPPFVCSASVHQIFILIERCFVQMMLCKCKRLTAAWDGGGGRVLPGTKGSWHFGCT